MGVGVALQLALVLGATKPLEITAAGDRAEIVLGEVADLSRLPRALHDRAADLVIASFRPTQTTMALPARRIALRARALMPALAPWFPDAPGQPVEIHRSVRPTETKSTAPACQRLTRFVPSGSPAAARDLEPVACDGEHRETPWRYEPGLRAARMLRDLHPGEIIAAIPAFALARVRPGERLFVSSRLGAVRVEREVRAVQPGHAGGWLFVRSADGAVFPAPTPSVSP